VGDSKRSTSRQGCNEEGCATSRAPGKAYCETHLTRTCRTEGCSETFRVNRTQVHCGKHNTNTKRLRKPRCRSCGKEYQRRAGSMQRYCEPCQLKRPKRQALFEGFKPWTPPEPSQPAGRICAEPSCGTILTRWNKNDTCYVHLAAAPAPVDIRDASYFPSTNPAVRGA
jgi:hypothetical protein